ncbi:protein containing small GTP-binding protein domain [Anaerolinea thermolimosa]|nr:protein containing small GTP-binding protein domain [Anaerolinea thermolimosa]
MKTIDEFIENLPPETREKIQTLWDTLPETERTAFEFLSRGDIPSNTTLLKLLVKLATTQLKMAFGDKKQVVILGPTNVGKSTLFNQLIQNATDRAEVSPLPGTTRQNKMADAGLFTIVDTPGADAVGETATRERQSAMEAARSADCIILVFDASQGIRQSELAIAQEIFQLQKPWVVVLNKIDLVKRDLDRVIELASKNLGLKPDLIIPVSARSGQNLSRVVMRVALVEPEMIAALGRGLPQFRRQLAWRTIISTATGAAAVALVPLPMIDFIPLAGLQTMMTLSIARIYQFEISPARARELIATLGLGYLGRTLFYELSKLGGIPGWLLSVAIAASVTVTMGYAAILWFESGVRISNATLNQISRQLTRNLIQSLKNLGKKRPGVETIQEELSSFLEKLQPDQILSPEHLPKEDTGESRPK